MTIAGLDSGENLGDLSTGTGPYHISLARLRGLHRSPVHLIAKRLTGACPSFDKPPHELDPLELIKEIGEFHEDDVEFIRYEMPIKEIVFRTLLARGNDPMTLSEIHQELTGRWSNALRPISIDESSLRRVLETDTYYGFAET